MKLYEYDNAIADLIANGTDPETGELVIDEQLFEQLQLEREAKIESMLLYLKDLNVFKANLKAEKDNITERIRKTESKIDSLTAFMRNVLNGEKFTTPKVQVSYRTSQAVAIDDFFMEWAEKYAPEYVRTKQTSEPDKDKIKAELKAGTEIPYARLEARTSMTVK